MTVEWSDDGAKDTTSAFCNAYSPLDNASRFTRFLCCLMRRDPHDDAGGALNSAEAFVHRSRRLSVNCLRLEG